jgi:uncharacterized protein
MKSIYCVFNKRNDTFLGLNVVRAAGKFARLRGLTGRLAPGQGLWVVPSHGTHALGLLFPVDVIYLDAENRVIHLIEHMTRFRVAPIRLNCASVLEMGAHTIYGSQTELGDPLLIGLPEDLPLGVKPLLASPPTRPAQGGADRSSVWSKR